MSASSLSQSAKMRGLITLLATTFLMWAGFFMVIPLVSVYYVDRLGWAAASIGVVLAARQLTQQGLTPFSGMLADRLGAKGLICAGLLLRAAGFALMAVATTFPMLLLSVVLAALGGSLFESPKNAAIAALTDESNRSRFYAWVGVASNLGLTLGTQIGVLLLGLDFWVVAVGAAACFVLTFFVMLIFFPPVRVAADEASSRGLTYGFRMALRDRPFVVFNLLLMGYWFMWVQLTISLPLAAREIGGSDSTVSWVYTLNSAMSIFFQYPVIRLASRWLRPMSVLVLGAALMALGLGGVALAHDLPGLLACVVLFASGALLGSPSQQTVAANLSNPAALGSYFGVNSLALAIGGSAGNLSGGLLYDLGKRTSLPQLPWVVFCLVGLMACAGLATMAARQRRALPASGPGPVEVPDSTAAAAVVARSGGSSE